MDYTKLPNYTAAVGKYTDAVANGADEKEQQKLFAQTMEVMGTEIVEKLADQTNEKINSLMSSRSAEVMSAEETKFFNDITSGVGNVEKTLPLEIINQVFDELTYAHPLLDIINFQDMGLRTKAITSDGIYNGGTAVWGTFAGDIQGKLNQNFGEHDFSQNKLTAFTVIPKDALDYSYDWLKTFIILQLSESIAVALEAALVNGDGNNKPVGLIKDATVVNGTTTYGDKTESADLSPLAALENSQDVSRQAAKILAPIMKKMSVSEKGIPLNIAGQAKILVNPQDYYNFTAMFLYLNANGVWVDILPFNIAVVQSMAVPAGKGIVFVANRYNAYRGKMTMQEFDQTFALEDLQLYTTKSFYWGKPKDNNASALVTIAAVPKG